MAKTNASPSGQLPQGAGGGFPSGQTAYGQPMPAAVNASAQLPNFAQAVPSLQNAGTAINPNPLSALGGAMSQFGVPAPPQPNAVPPAPSATPTAEQLQQQVQIIQMLQQQGIPPDQWAVVLQALMSAGAAGAPPAVTPTPQNQSYNQNPPNFASTSRDHDRSQGYGIRSPPGHHRRSRSRSPPHHDRRRGEDSPRRRRDSPVYGAYGRSDDPSKRDAYRQRSPDRDRRRRSVTPPNRNRDAPASGPKNIQWDRTLPRDHIKGKCPDLTLKYNLD